MGADVNTFCGKSIPQMFTNEKDGVSDWMRVQLSQASRVGLFWGC